MTIPNRYGTLRGSKGVDRVKTKVLLRWVNSVTNDEDFTVEDIQEDFKNGIVFCMLLQKLTGKKLAFSRRPRNHFHITENMALAVQTVMGDLGANSYLVSDLQEGMLEQTSDFIFCIMKKYVIMSAASNETSPNKQANVGAMRSKQILQEELKKSLQEFRELVDDMETNVNNGLLLAAFLQTVNPSACSFDEMRRLSKHDRLQRIFEGFFNANIDPLLDMEDIVEDIDPTLAIIVLAHFLHILRQVEKGTYGKSIRVSSASISDATGVNSRKGSADGHLAGRDSTSSWSIEILANGTETQANVTNMVYEEMMAELEHAQREVEDLKIQLINVEKYREAEQLRFEHEKKDAEEKHKAEQTRLTSRINGLGRELERARQTRKEMCNYLDRKMPNPTTRAADAIIRLQAICKGYLARKDYVIGLRNEANRPSKTLTLGQNLWAKAQRRISSSHNEELRVVSEQETTARNSVIQQMVAEEERHLEYLRQVMNFYFNPLSDYVEQSKGSLTRQQLYSIFPPLERFIALHSTLIELFRDENACSHLGINLVSHVEQFNIFVQYVDDYATAVLIVDERSRKDVTFKDLCSGQAGPDRRIVNLKASLMLPFQRLPALCEGLKTLANKTSDRHPDYEGTFSAYEALRSINEKVSTKRREQENRENLLNVHLKLNNEIDKATLSKRMYLKEGRMKEFSQSSKDKEKSHDRYYFLFDDLLIACKIRKRMFAAHPEYKVVFTAPITHESSITDLGSVDPDATDSQPSFRVQLSKDKAILLGVKNNADKKAWTEAFRSAVMHSLESYEHIPDSLKPPTLEGMVVRFHNNNFERLYMCLRGKQIFFYQRKMDPQVYASFAVAQIGDAFTYREDTDKAMSILTTMPNPPVGWIAPPVPQDDKMIPMDALDDDGLFSLRAVAWPILKKIMAQYNVECNMDFLMQDMSRDNSLSANQVAHRSTGSLAKAGAILGASADVLNAASANSLVSLAIDDLPNGIPFFFKDLIHYLEEDDHVVEGLFRVSGNSKRMAKAREMMEETERFSPEEDGYDVNPHDVAGLLKNILRELPDPLATGRLFTLYMALPRIPENLRLRTLQLINSYLPVSNRRVLGRLMIMLRRLAKHEEKTKMTASNLAVCLAPNILAPSSEHGTRGSAVGPLPGDSKGETSGRFGTIGKGLPMAVSSSMNGLTRENHHAKHSLAVPEMRSTSPTKATPRAYSSGHVGAYGSNGSLNLVGIPGSGSSEVYNNASHSNNNLHRPNSPSRGYVPPAQTVVDVNPQLVNQVFSMIMELAELAFQVPGDLADGLNDDESEGSDEDIRIEAGTDIKGSTAGASAAAVATMSKKLRTAADSPISPENSLFVCVCPLSIQSGPGGSASGNATNISVSRSTLQEDMESGGELVLFTETLVERDEWNLRLAAHAAKAGA
eukprot:Clim_evm86s149 gene=Clim_evmTU86s149